MSVSGQVRGGTLTVTYELTVFDPADNSVIQTDHERSAGPPITA